MFSEMDDSKKQAKWDDWCDAPDVPRCSICGASVRRNGDHFYEHGDSVVCANCAPAFSDAMEMAMIGRIDRVKAGAMRHIQEVAR